MDFQSSLASIIFFSFIFGNLAFNDAFARPWTVPFVFLHFDSTLNRLLLMLEIDDLFVLLLDLGHELALGLLGSLVLDLCLSEPIHDLASLAFELAISQFVLVQRGFLQLSHLIVPLCISVELLKP